jgi:hypothetical protein
MFSQSLSHVPGVRTFVVTAMSFDWNEELICNQSKSSSGSTFTFSSPPTKYEHITFNSRFMHINITLNLTYFNTSWRVGHYILGIASLTCFTTLLIQLVPLFNQKICMSFYLLLRLSFNQTII